MQQVVYSASSGVCWKFGRQIPEGALVNKAWPHGALTVGEVAAEYSYLGGESIARCCKYKGFVLNQWMERQMTKDLYAGALGLVYCVCGWL